MGMGQSLSALAHGSAHAHEAEHRAPAAVVHEHAHDHDSDHALADAPDAHHHEHPHAMVDAGLKSRSDASPDVAEGPSVPALPFDLRPERQAPRASQVAPAPERRHTPASPRAPPAR